MTLSIDREHTALLAMDFENDIVHENGAFKDLGFAQMVKQNDVLGKTARLLDAARGAGVKVIYVSVKFRPGYPEISDRNKIFRQRKTSGQPAAGDPLKLIHPSLRPAEGEIVVGKHRVNALYGTGLDVVLRANDIETLIIMV